jgi:1-acyl-sn-glycerol-3-phosphate acyltransferase
MMLGIAWELGIDFRFLGKDSLFKFPLGPLMRALGGIPVDRKRPYGLVEKLVAAAEANDEFTLVVTPEGTRGSGKYWKSGFYRISTQTGIPVTLGYVDRESRTCGLGVTFTPTGNVHEDMDFVRDFYKDKSGYRPQFRTEPRLREEDRAPEISDDSPASSDA